MSEIRQRFDFSTGNKIPDSDLGQELANAVNSFFK
jgi:hypothetical protein